MRKIQQRRTEQVLIRLGSAMRDRRIELEMTQDEVGKAARLHRTYVTDVENGMRNLSFLTLLKIASALQCPLSLLISEAENKGNGHAD